MTNQLLINQITSLQDMVSLHSKQIVSLDDELCTYKDRLDDLEAKVKYFDEQNKGGQFLLKYSVKGVQYRAVFETPADYQIAKDMLWNIMHADSYGEIYDNARYKTTSGYDDKGFSIKTEYDSFD